MISYKNKYPLSTLKGASKKEFEDFIDSILNKYTKEILNTIIDIELVDNNHSIEQGIQYKKIKTSINNIREDIILK